MGSNPIRVASTEEVFCASFYSSSKLWDLSSAGRASALQAEGHRFEPCRPHHLCRLGSMAEQLICNQQVVGSTPTVGSLLMVHLIIRCIIDIYNDIWVDSRVAKGDRL